MKTFLIMLLMIHGLIHLAGFVRAFGILKIPMLVHPISGFRGLIWLVLSSLFITASIFLMTNAGHWWILALIAVFFSQLMIFVNWQDAKYGSFANLLIMAGAIAAWGTDSFEQLFRKDVQYKLEKSAGGGREVLREADLIPLPEPVRKYLRYVGVVGKPKPFNARIVFEGEMRDRGKDYFHFSSEQFNFFDRPARLFFMKGKIFGFVLPGYHRYSEGKATMDIKPFGLFSMISLSGDTMNKAETVTVFNDMCLLAPATLIDQRIRWELINDSTVKGVFVNGQQIVSARLYFNKEGQLINFQSEDRTDISDMKRHLFSTPVSAYRRIGDYNLMSRAEAVWTYPEGDFTYGRFILKDIQYNYQ